MQKTKKGCWDTGCTAFSLSCVFSYLLLKRQNKSIKPQSWIICRELINWKAPTISAFPHPPWPVMSYVVDPLAPQLIVYTTKSAFLAGLDNLAKWNYRPGPLPDFTSRFHYLTVSLCRLGAGMSHWATFVHRAVGTKWGTLHAHTDIAKKRPHSVFQCVEREAWSPCVEITKDPELTAKRNVDFALASLILCRTS